MSIIFMSLWDRLVKKMHLINSCLLIEHVVQRDDKFKLDGSFSFILFTVSIELTGTAPTHPTHKTKITIFVIISDCEVILPN